MSDSSRTSAPGATSATLPADVQKGQIIFQEPDRLDSQEDVSTRSPTLVAQSPKKHRANTLGKKMTGRPPLQSNQSNQSITSLNPQLSNLKLDSLDQPNNEEPDSPDPRILLSQVFDWLQEERSKRATKQKHHLRTPSGNKRPKDQATADEGETGDSELSLERLERILAGFDGASSAAFARLPRKQSSLGLRRGSIAKKFIRSGAATSDTDAFDAVAEVPHVEASLDNTKTMAYTGGEAGVDTGDDAKQRDQLCWETFKQDIIRLTHTLKLRGWRRLPLDQASLIHVERLSGALTNAVYVVKPPEEPLEKKGDSATSVPFRKPQQLLLRIYGPQVEHLIDREHELGILRRLAVKNIGPKLLGYFSNGRFEEYLHAKTLDAEDLRDAATSKQIAKRMRELHDGIELLESERSSGPSIFKNWDKSVARAEKVCTWLDKQIHEEKNGNSSVSKRYTRRGLVCGVEWPVFRNAYQKYREKLVEESGGWRNLRKNLVFAHNDTQYGNLMRLIPPSESPLLQPTNQHKQLVVIDFEYASPNLPGQEFANHFTEWCYNYHHAEKSWACNTQMYPTPQEQHRFIRAYVMHRPQFASSASSTPHFEGKEKTNIPDFMLDARAPGGGYGFDYDAEEQAREKAQEEEIQKLLHQTRLWRIANSAWWVTWGIVQAPVPELDESRKRSMAGAVLDKVMQHFHPHSDPLDPDVKEKQEQAHHDRPEARAKEEAHHEGEEEEEDDEFDYLAYAHDRAMFFWGDCIQMGIVNEEDLPEEMRKDVKYVKY